MTNPRDPGDQYPYVADPDMDPQEANARQFQETILNLRPELLEPTAVAQMDREVTRTEEVLEDGTVRDTLRLGQTTYRKVDG